MARKKVHEDHLNHEAWAIPYGDLITLLLAFFVVMYAISTVNEGKYRVLSDSLSVAFKGPPRTLAPVQVGEAAPSGLNSGFRIDIRPRLRLQELPLRSLAETLSEVNSSLMFYLQEYLDGLIGDGKARLRLVEDGVEIAVGSDILFASGSARVDKAADPILRQIAAALAPLNHHLRVEGHTDNVPINTWQFPSNWELSAGRAAWVVRRLAESGITPDRLSMQGYGEHRPVASNATAEGRRENRRVAIIVNTRHSVEAALAEPDGALMAQILQGPGHERTDLSSGG